MGSFYRVIYGLVSALALSLPAYGADAQFATWGGAVLEGGSAPTNGWSRQYNIEKRVGSRTSVVTRSLPLDLSGYGDLAKYTKRSLAVDAAVVGAVAAAGWAIEELTDQVTKPAGSLDGSTLLYAVGGVGVTGYGLTKDSACTSIGGFMANDTYCRDDNPFTFYNPVVETTCSQSPGASACISPEKEVPFSELWPVIQEALKNLPSSAIKDMFWDPATDQPYIDPGVQDLLDDVKDEAQGEEDEEPQECPAGQKLENDQCVPEETECPSGQVKNAQGQCEDDNPCKDLGKNYVYNSETKSCDYDEPEHPEIDIEEIGKVDFDSGLGDGSCPAPIVQNMPGGQVVYDFETPCDITTYLVKPALLIGASILAAFTVVGRLG